MEDRHNIRAFLSKHGDVSLLAVYDGHGGSEVAAMCSLLLPGIIRGKLDEVEDAKDWRTWKEVIVKSIAELDARCVSEIRAKDVGSTLCMCLFSYSVGKVVTANLGDSRMVLLRRHPAQNIAVQTLTVDHSSSCPHEQERIVAIGGYVFPDVFGTPRVMGCLNLTRSVGDSHLRPFISQVPDVAEYDLRRNDVLFVASDGLWDVIHPGDLVRAASVVKNFARLPRVLTNAAMMKGSSDNITAAMVWQDDETMEVHKKSNRYERSVSPTTPK